MHSVEDVIEMANFILEQILGDNIDSDDEGRLADIADFIDEHYGKVGGRVREQLGELKEKLRRARDRFAEWEMKNSQRSAPPEFRLG